jgi:drug/metabolite transporter (DMT)-like permease
MNNIQRGTIVALGSAIILGLYPAAIRYVYADGGNVMFMMLCCTWARALLPGLYCLVTRQKIFQSRLDTRHALMGGIFQAISTITVFGGFLFLPGPLVMIILYSHTLMFLFFTAWKGETKLDKITVATTVMALAGLTLVLDIWHRQGEAHLIGIALATTAAVATVSRLYVYGKQMQNRNPSAVGVENFLVVGVIITFGAFIFSPHLPHSVIGYYYAAAGSASLALGTFGMFYGIALMGAFRWSLFLKLEPVFTALFSFLILGEILKPLQYLGMAVVLGSLATYQVCSHLQAMRIKALDISESVEAIS